MPTIVRDATAVSLASAVAATATGYGDEPATSADPGWGGTAGVADVDFPGWIGVEVSTPTAVVGGGVVVELLGGNDSTGATMSVLASSGEILAADSTTSRKFLFNAYVPYKYVRVRILEVGTNSAGTVTVGLVQPHTDRYHKHPLETASPADPVAGGDTGA